MTNTESKDRAGVVVRVQPQGDEVLPEASEEFVATPHIQDLADRALAYLGVGYAVHLAMHLTHVAPRDGGMSEEAILLPGRSWS